MPNLECRLQTISVYKNVKFVVWERVKKKKVWEKEKMLGKSIFFFSQTIFYHFQTNFIFFFFLITFICRLQVF